jgi:hypothetical protein
VAKELFGYVPDRKASAKIVAGLKYPTFEAGSKGLTLDTSKPTLLYPALLTVAPWWKRGSQGIGSCVGWGFSLGTDILSSVEIVSRGEPEEWPGRVLEAGTYAFSRCEALGVSFAGFSDGSYGAAAAKALTQFGTLHYGRDYKGKTFSRYSSVLEKNWGANGVPDDLEPFAKQHKIKTASLATTFEAAALAIQNGFPVCVCSTRGFDWNTRDKDGFCKPYGVAAHCMMFAGVRFDRPGLLCFNSWGDYLKNAGPHWPANMPDAVANSSFWIDAKVAESEMLSKEDSFALSGYDGFPARKLSGYGFDAF